MLILLLTFIINTIFTKFGFGEASSINSRSPHQPCPPAALTSLASGLKILAGASIICQHIGQSPSPALDAEGEGLAKSHPTAVTQSHLVTGWWCISFQLYFYFAIFLFLLFLLDLSLPHNSWGVKVASGFNPEVPGVKRTRKAEVLINPVFEPSYPTWLTTGIKPEWSTLPLNWDQDTCPVSVHCGVGVRSTCL